MEGCRLPRMTFDLYAYLLLGLFFFVLWTTCFTLRPDLRSMMLRVSLVGAIAGPLSELWYFHDYWSPPTLVGQGVVSPEDVLFGFAVFGVAVAALPVITGIRFAVTEKPCPAVLPLFIASFFVGFVVLTDVFGINSIIAASLVMVLWTIGMLSRRPTMFMLSLGSGLLLAAFSVVIYVVLLGIATEYLSRYWFLWGTPLGLTVLGGVPVTEIVWYFCLGVSAAVLAPYAEGKCVV